MAETIAVVFTDLVGSTRLLSELGDDAFDAFRREHFALLRSAIEQHRGTEVKSLGDGLMAVFGSASDAIAAAVAMQAASDRHGLRAGAMSVGLRVGASMGDATAEDGDWFGTPVVEAARLCAECGPGDVLVTDVMRVLAGSRAVGPIEPLGSRQLRGLPVPIAVCAVRWEAAVVGDAPPLPSVLASAAQMPFAGRTEALAEVRSCQSATVGGSARTVFVAGEPGIGKTRLVAQICVDLHADGAVVLFGRSEDAIDVPFRPFSEVLDRLVRQAPQEVLDGHLAAIGGALCDLVPALGERTGSMGGDLIRTESDAQRLRLFGAVADLLRRQSEVAPLVLVLDDVHWADESSLLLLRHLVSALDDARVLVLATYRDTDLYRRHPLAAVLADFRRVPGVVRIALDGLSPAEVVEYLAIASGEPLAPEGVQLGEQLADITDGNPFFLTETLRHLVEQGAIVERDGRWVAGDVTPEEVGVPVGIREVVGRRLSAFDDVTEDVLRVAAVAGAHFDVASVAAVAGLEEGEVIDRLDRAAGRALVAEDADRFGWYRFAHALVRQTVLEELSSTKRIRAHRAIAEELERRAPDRVEEIAHHYLEAAAAGVAGKGIEFATAAGRQALDRGAPEQATRWFGRALEVDDGLAPDPVRRCQVLLLMGESLNWSNQHLQARDGLLEAAELARAASRPDLLAMAAYRYLGPWGIWVDMGDAHRGPLLDEALASLPAEEFPALRVRLLVKYWNEVQFDPDGARQDAAEAEMLQLIPTIDEPLARWEGLIQCAVAYYSKPDIERLDQLVVEALAVEGLDPVHEAETVGTNRAMARRFRGDFAGAAADASHYREVAARGGQVMPFVAFGEPASQASVEGRFDDARAGFGLLRAASRSHLDLLSAMAGDMWVDLWLADADRLRAEVDGLPEVTLRFADFYPVRPVERLLAGDLDGARTSWSAWKPLLDLTPRFAAAHLASWATYPAWRLADREVAEVSLERLRPFTGLWPTPNLAVCNGPADLHIGINLLTLARAEEAEPLLRSAVDDALRCGAPAWAAYGSLAHAVVLHDLDRHEESAVAGSRSKELATSFAMVQVLRDLAATGSADLPARVAPD